MTSTAIKRIRAALGLSQAAFAERLGVRRETVARWEIGTRTMPEPVARFARRLLEEAPARPRRRRR